MNPEYFANIPGYPGYQISSWGRLRTDMSRRNGGFRRFTADRKGYCRVRLWRTGLPMKTCYVHRLVAAAFIPNPENLPEVDHRDGDPENNGALNLRWVTHKDNLREAVIRRGAHWCTGNSHVAQHVPIRRIDPQTGEVLRFESVRAAIDELNRQIVAAGGVAKPYLTLAGNICHARNRDKISYGYKWESARGRPLAR